MKREILTTDQAPAAIGPYSQGIKAGNLVFTSGQIPVNPATGKIISDDFTDQVRQVLENLAAVLQAGGSSLKNVIKLTVFVTDLANFGKLNEVFKTHFPEAPGARSAVQVSQLPLDVQVEIEAIGLVED